MKVFFYYYYRFYRFFDPDPYLAATLGLTALEGLLVNGILNIALAYFFCYDLKAYFMIGVVAIILLINTFYFFTSKKAKDIVKLKPMFFKNHKLSILLVLILSLLIISTLFWTGDLTNRIIDHCH